MNRHSHRNRTFWLGSFVLTFALVATGCGDNDDGSTSTDTGDDTPMMDASVDVVEDTETDVAEDVTEDADVAPTDADSGSPDAADTGDGGRDADVTNDADADDTSASDTETDADATPDADPDTTPDADADTTDADTGDTDAGDAGDADAGDAGDTGSGIEAPSLTATVLDSGDVELDWNVDDFDGVTTFGIYYATESGVGPDSYAGLSDGATRDSAVPLIFDDLPVGREVFFVVTAKFGDEEGPTSNEASVVPFRSTLRGIEARFPDNGSQWGDWVAAGGADAPCDVDAAEPCVHGGELRVFDVPELESCDGVTAEDTIGALQWTCEPAEGGEGVRVVSTGLAEGAHLSDLINFAPDTPTWAENDMVVRRNGNLAVVHSFPREFWDNTIEVFNSAGVVDPNVVAVVTTSHSGTITLSGGASLVTARGVTVAGVFINASDFIWVEADIDHGGATFPAVQVLNETSSYLVFDNTHAYNVSSGDCFRLQYVEHVWFRDTSANNCLQECYDIRFGTDLNMDGATGSECVSDIYGIYEVDDVTIIDSGAFSGEDSGFLLSDVDNLSMVNVVAANNAGSGIAVQGSNLADEQLEATANNILVANALIANNRSFPVAISSEANNIVLREITAVNNGGDFILLEDDNREQLRFAYVTNVLTVNNGGGFRLRYASDYTFADVAAIAHGGSAITLNDTQDGVFDGLLVMGLNGADDCDVFAGMNPGIADDCSGARATIVAPESADGIFVGPVGDTIEFSDVTTWTLERPMQAYGRRTAGFPNGDSRGPCDADSSTTCQRWDFTLRSDDTGIERRPSVLDVLDPPRVGEVRRIQVLANERECEAFGGTWTVGSELCVVEPMIHAQEIFGDAIGDDDGLCEFGEHCLHTPNIGAYQGHGELEIIDRFGTDYVIWAYTENGVE